ncbi:type II toxin-antitoxin system Phd/YefM family antitoxin [uncultured Jatrophihabitans sp.]|uniref:type II toxin-antitoxin system Phd/YefM family antitoxin n=1 Tax=uncultured Jatrophihabitans sp. TaxID=1610747 RepID=UPI0035CAFFFF
MERIGVRELRQHASRYLDRVRAGETVEVTDRGRLVALLVPPDPAQSARDQLIAQGRLKPAAGPMALPTRTRPRENTSAVLDELRSEDS